MFYKESISHFSELNRGRYARDCSLLLRLILSNKQHLYNYLNYFLNSEEEITKFGWQPLYLACLLVEDSMNLIPFLEKYQFSSNITKSLGNIAYIFSVEVPQESHIWHALALGNHWDLVKEAITLEYISPYISDDRNYTLWHYFACRGNMDALQYGFNNRWFTNNIKGFDGNTIGHCLSLSGDLDKLKHAITLNMVDPTNRNSQGKSIWHFLAQSGNLQAVEQAIAEELFHERYELDHLNSDIWDWFAASGNLETITQAIQNKHYIMHTRDRLGGQFNHYIALSTNLNLMKEAARQKWGNLNWRDDANRTIWHYFVLRGSCFNLLEALIDGACNLNDLVQKDRHGKTPIDYLHSDLIENDEFKRAYKALQTISSWWSYQGEKTIQEIVQSPLLALFYTMEKFKDLTDEKAKAIFLQIMIRSLQKMMADWKFHALSFFMTEKSLYNKPHFGAILNKHNELTKRIVQNLSNAQSLKLLKLIPSCFRKLKQELCFVVQSKFGPDSFEGYRALSPILQEVSFNDGELGEGNNLENAFVKSIDKEFLSLWPQWLKKGIKQNKNLEELITLEESKEKTARIGQVKNVSKEPGADWIVDIKEPEPIVSSYNSINRINEEFSKMDLIPNIRKPRLV